MNEINALWLVVCCRLLLAEVAAVLSSSVHVVDYTAVLHCTHYSDPLTDRDPCDSRQVLRL